MVQKSAKNSKPSLGLDIKTSLWYFHDMCVFEVLMDKLNLWFYPNDLQLMVQFVLLLCPDVMGVASKPVRRYEYETASPAVHGTVFAHCVVCSRVGRNICHSILSRTHGTSVRYFFNYSTIPL